MKYKNKLVKIKNKEIYKQLQFGHTPLELKSSLSTVNTIREFEDLVKEAIEFVQ